MNCGLAKLMVSYNYPLVAKYGSCGIQKMTLLTRRKLKLEPDGSTRRIFRKSIANSHTFTPKASELCLIPFIARFWHSTKWRWYMKISYQMIKDTYRSFSASCVLTNMKKESSGPQETGNLNLEWAGLSSFERFAATVEFATATTVLPLTLKYFWSVFMAYVFPVPPEASRGKHRE